MTTKVKEPVEIKEWCRGCGICVVLCPENVLVLGMGDKASPLFIERCTYCKLCEIRCPDQAIIIVDD